MAQSSKLLSETFQYFKYRQVDKYLLDCLVKSQIYFAHKSKLNDPFDCNVDISNVMKHLLKNKEDEKFNRLSKLNNDNETMDKFADAISSLGICSFSLSCEETLMWSHYADDHRGVCLLYEFEEEYLNNGEEFFGCAKVRYEENYVSDWLYNQIDIYERSPEHFLEELFKVYLTSKAPSWKYEKEARVIRREEGQLTVPRKSLTQIVFGLQTPEEDKELILSIINKYYSDVQICKVVRKTSKDFGIEVIAA